MVFPMPELAEVEFYRKQWDAGRGQAVAAVRTTRMPKLFRGGMEPERAAAVFRKSVFSDSSALGKQMLCQFRRDGTVVGFIGVHLGMTGKLLCRPAGVIPGKHDHLVLTMANGLDLVFTDPRRFGRIRLATGETEPDWWTGLPVPVLSADFTRRRFAEILDRRRKAPLKAVLLSQDAFPGVGNWMADEILWQARLHPGRTAGGLDEGRKRGLYRVLRSVCRGALRTIGEDFSDPPKTWLFRYRWKAGQACPRCRNPLCREEIAGRTTCYCRVCLDD